MSDSPKSPDQINDGFDLIEYPCDYAFKAMCRADDSLSSVDYIKGLIMPLLDDGALLGLKSNASRTGKFESVTVTVRLTSRDQLESIYHLIARAPRVVMTL